MNPRKHASTFMASPKRSRVGPARKRRALGFFLAGIVLLFHSSGSGQEKPNTTPQNEPAIDPRILQVKRICVRNFGEDPLGIQVQEMVIAKLFESKRFSLTENCERADVVLKGSITERSESTYRSESEGIGFGRRVAGSESSSSRMGSASSSASSSVSTGVTGSDHESLSSSEVKQYAAVTLRVVDKEGDILWATSQESAKGKTKGAIGFAAERAVRRLLRDIEKAEKQAKNSQPSQANAAKN